jgi:hypothetical protein
MSSVAGRTKQLCYYRFYDAYEPVIVDDKIILNKIYFDLNKSNIRPDARSGRLVKPNEQIPYVREVKAETFADIRAVIHITLHLHSVELNLSSSMLHLKVQTYCRGRGEAEAGSS